MAATVAALSFRGPLAAAPRRSAGFASKLWLVRGIPQRPWPPASGSPLTPSLSSHSSLPPAVRSLPPAAQVQPAPPGCTAAPAAPPDTPAGGGAAALGPAAVLFVGRPGSRLPAGQALLWRHCAALRPSRLLVRFPHRCRLHAGDRPDRHVSPLVSGGPAGHLCAQLHVCCANARVL